MFLSRIRPVPLTSIRTRLTALFVAIFGLVLIGYSALLYKVFVGNQMREFDAALFNYAVDVAYSIDLDLFGGVSLKPNLLNDSEKVFPFALGETFLQIRTMDGRSFARSRSLGRGTLPLSREDREDLLSKRVLFGVIGSREFSRSLPANASYRLIDYLIDKPTVGQFVLQIAVPMQILRSEKRELITFFAFSIPLVLLIGAIGGLYLSRSALMPVNTIIGKVREITARKLSARVPIPRVKDEMHGLAVTLNDLLDRLERAFQGQESFVSDASHQLKTPLAILRGEIDLMRSRPRSPEEVTAFLASASQEVGYLSRVVENLLMLARIDAGGSSLAIQKARLDEITLDAVARLEQLASSKGVRFSVNLSSETGDPMAPYELEADPELLRSMLESLLENAVKYSPEDGTVTIELGDSADQVTAAVSDQGEGIPEEALTKIFDRFYRAEKNRALPGSGLGLAIVKKIVEAHGGVVSASNTPGAGANFKVTLRKKQA